MEKIKVFISQPMSGLTNEQIIEDRNKATELLKEFYKGKYEVEIIDNFQMDVEKKQLEYLGYDIKCMADADQVFFIGDYINHRGCLVEEFVAKKYNYSCLYESEVRDYFDIRKKYAK